MKKQEELNAAIEQFKGELLKALDGIPQASEKLRATEGRVKEWLQEECPYKWPEGFNFDEVFGDVVNDYSVFDDFDEQEIGEKVKLYLLSKQPVVVPPGATIAGRRVGLQLSGFEDYLLQKIKTGTIPQIEIRPGRVAKLTKYDLAAFSLAIYQILHAISIQNGHKDTFEGEGGTTEVIKGYYRGRLNKPTIYFSLDDIAKAAYGVSTYETRARIAGVLQAYDQNKLTTIYPGGVVVEQRLCSVDTKITTPGGKVYFSITLSSLFSCEIQNQFGLIPEGLTAKLAEACKKNKQRRTGAMLRAARWVIFQQQKERLVTYERLAEEMGMKDDLQQRKKQTMNTIIQNIRVLEAAQLIEIKRITPRGAVIKHQQERRKNGGRYP